MKITDLRDHFSHNFSRSKAMRIARLLEQYDHPKIQNSYLASSRITSSNVYYIIWRKGGGFFSILSSVLCHLQIAENLGFSPVVDFKNFTSTYSENEQINGSHNMWEYYFEPIQSVPLNKVYESGNFVLTDGGHPAGAVMSVSHDESLRDTFRKYVVLNSTTLAALASAKQKVEIDEFTLGIHFRGQEMRRARGHPFPPTLQQVFSNTDLLLERGSFKHIFLVTEGAEYEKAFTTRYGSLVQTLPHYRRFRKNSYSIYPRMNHRFLLGQEILVDTLLLAECNSLISGSSNVSEMAILLNANRYNINCQIRNGTNSQSILLAPFLWQIKSGIPTRFGGFDKNHSSGVIG